MTIHSARNSIIFASKSGRSFSTSVSVDPTPGAGISFFFCSNALIALARSLCKYLLAVLIIASGANTVKGYLVRCARIDDTIP